MGLREFIEANRDAPVEPLPPYEVDAMAQRLFAGIEPVRVPDGFSVVNKAFAPGTRLGSWGNDGRKQITVLECRKAPDGVFDGDRWLISWAEGWEG